MNRTASRNEIANTFRQYLNEVDDFYDALSDFTDDLNCAIRREGGRDKTNELIMTVDIEGAVDELRSIVKGEANEKT